MNKRTLFEIARVGDLARFKRAVAGQTCLTPSDWEMIQYHAPALSLIPEFAVRQKRMATGYYELVRRVLAIARTGNVEALVDALGIDHDISDLPMADIAREGACLPPDVFLFTIQAMANSGDYDFTNTDLFEKIDAVCRFADRDTKKRVLDVCQSCHSFLDLPYDVHAHERNMDL